MPKIIYLISFIFLLFQPIGPVQATDYSSTNFFVRDPSVGQGGTGNATSTNFQLRGVLGQRAEGRGTSTNFAGAAGSQYYDDTAPTGGVVNDGAGADIDYQDDMTTLAANWSGFADAESGLAKYEYRLRRIVDNLCWNAGSNAWAACDVWNSTALVASFSVNHANLALRTGSQYESCVRATNNANVVGLNVCSNGVSINPSLTFGVSPSSVTFNSLNGGNNNNDSQTTTLTTSTNAYNGYDIKASRTTMLTFGATTIPDFAAGTYGSPAAWGTGQCSGTSCGFGYTSSDTTVGAGQTDLFAGATKFAPFNATGPGDTVADHKAVITGAPVSNENFTITNKVAVLGSQKAGTYTTAILYTIVPQY